MTQAISLAANNALDLTGRRFGKLVAIAVSRIHITPKGRATMWLCRCDCGKEAEYRVGALRSGNAASCGCKRLETLAKSVWKHRLSHRVPEYALWKAMRSRCRNPNNKDYKNYGGRGIIVCERWDDFINFYNDMGSRERPDYTIDRIDVNGNYEPSNCRWLPMNEQSRNRRCVLEKKERQ